MLKCVTHNNQNVTLFANHIVYNSDLSIIKIHAVSGSYTIEAIEVKYLAYKFLTNTINT